MSTMLTLIASTSDRDLAAPRRLLMADENNTGVAAETVTPETAPLAKKTRGPNRKKVATEAVSAADTVAAEAPMKKTRAKRGEKAAATKLIKAAKAEKAAKTPRAPAASKPAAKVAVAPVASASVAAASASDEFADLLKLEEENKALRKQLGEKLRAENADLKKRLGAA
jgi:hypothetical protein